ncbi:MAG TPA: response regulator [Verrucomicrobiae bacterium]|nr:response regulator [Verrucomicrobiae bacterium]
MDANDSPVNVLVVANNEEAVLQAVSSTLAKAGFAVTGASSAAGALSRCRDGRAVPELAVIDTTVPGIDLQDFVFQLHQIAPAMRVLLLSGEAPSETVRSLRARWRAKLLSKPFRRSQLLGQVLALMDEPLVLTA